MKVLITGANGFLGKNLVAHLAERKDVEIQKFIRNDSIESLKGLLSGVDFVFHLAGVNRPQSPTEFVSGNTTLTKSLCEAITATGRQIPVLYTSSIQADHDNPYGVSKKEAENALMEFALSNGSAVHVFRLPNVFGKWARPDYNSAVATFCHNIARGLPININDPEAPINLVYIDDVIDHFVSILDGKLEGKPSISIKPQYSITVGELAAQLESFRGSRQSLVIDAVGLGLTRALYSTYLSYLPPESFTYAVPKHDDERGVFVEMLKTKDSGQFSFFTAHPGVTRGGHYHHSKTEKFLVVKGSACFRFRHIVTDEFYELFTSGDEPVIVETVPGWTHDITNVGDDEMVVMLWANEIFNRERPDTYARLVGTGA
ncbi:NAD-dependent epimerase/dehydratase family protein [Paenalcaligenes niemegkensis]|uniref:UDP-2-acetamido-2,6-beta-L-arabino-hexul-4-ose reductase n=1 Tax=Paenalcaligenes niemegkensis TaxID=2895469 RepID=UPI001EE9A261|nr:NAD-dependent epimerase/dehydratase family protein [Paenalcaligenes niemegkensis]MCQ9618260.1 NAD-dependent epimerase/dehydratase family protein [Paenalcaligenes niemegkensis]